MLTMRRMVAVRIHGEWKAVCGNGWDDMDAQVVCRSLGYSVGYAFNRYTTDVCLTEHLSAVLSQTCRQTRHSLENSLYS